MSALIVFSLVAQEPRFNARSRLVVVPTTVTDAQGQVVDGLEASEFLVFDNGTPRIVAVDTIGTADAPIALIIAIQSSGISAPVLEKVRKIGSMIHPLIAGDRGCVGLLSFAQSVNWLQSCTTDADALNRAMGQLRPGDPKRARMLDAVSAATEHLRGMPNARRVLLLISESRDRNSETDLKTATTTAQAAGISVYAATYSAFKTAFTTSKPPQSTMKRPPAPPGDNPMGTIDGGLATKSNSRITPPEQRVDILAGMGELARLGTTDTTKVLTAATGGTAFPFTRQKGLEKALEALGSELHTQYLLSFAPDSSMRGFHKLEVRIARRSQLEVRARPGYWSTE